MKNKVAIIGVGTQGSMIAFRNAVYGKEVTAYSRNLSSRERCAERIERFLEFYVQTGRLMQAEADQSTHYLRFHIGGGMQGCVYGYRKYSGDT